MRRTRTARRSAILALAVLLSACGSAGETVESGAPLGGFDPADLECSDSAAAILRSGLPTYDYDPSPDLEALIASSDLVVSGTLNRAMRESGPHSLLTEWTRVEAAEYVVVHGEPGTAADRFAEDGAFLIDASGPDDDPLASPVSYDPAMIRFIAFLNAAEPDTPLLVHIEGLHVGCGADPAVPVIQPLPPGVVGSVGDIESAVRAVVDPPSDPSDIDVIPHQLIVSGVEVRANEMASVLTADEVRARYGADLDLVDGLVHVEFIVGESGSCPLGSLSHLEFNRGTRELYPVVNDGDHGSEVCTADFNPHPIVVSISPDDLPSGEVVFTTGPDRPGTLWTGDVSDSSSASLDGPVVRHLAPLTNEGEDAEVRGIIDIEGDCLYLRLDEIGQRFQVVWPATTGWDPVAERLTLPNGDSVGAGDRVWGGGGYTGADSVDRFVDEAAAQRLRACVDDEYGEIAVVNNTIDGIGVVSEENE